MLIIPSRRMNAAFWCKERRDRIRLRIQRSSRIGSCFDGFLIEQGLLEEVTASAYSRIRAFAEKK